MYEGTDTVVLYEELAYEDVLPLLWRPHREPLDPAVVTGFSERNLHVLQACAAIEEHGQQEKKDDTSPVASELLRLDLKVNLLLDLLGQLVVANNPRPPAVPVRFNALGATWKAQGQELQPGGEGVLEIYLRDSLPQPLRLLGRITAADPDGRVKARFIPPSETIADLLEKLAFRRHRRQVAGARQSRRN
jgi:Atypical PilZ domain, cyclic di-GMP receptor